MKILLTGANGFIGKHVAEALQRDGHELILVSRSTGNDFTQMRHIDDWQPLLSKVDAVINSVGIIVENKKQSFENIHAQAPIALFQAAANAGVKKIIQISALGADDQAFTAYQRSKKKADDYLRQLEIDWCILRPSLVYGEAGTSTKLFKRMATLVFIPVIGGGTQEIQPVHVEDLVSAIIQALLGNCCRQTVDIVGPEKMYFVTWLKRLRSTAGKRATFTISVPVSVVMLFASFAKYFIPIMHPDNLSMLIHGNTADCSGVSQLLQRKPRHVP